MCMFAFLGRRVLSGIGTFLLSQLERWVYIEAQPDEDSPSRCSCVRPSSTENENVLD